MRYCAVKYDKSHPDRAYAEQWLTRPGLPHLSPAAIGNTPHFFHTERNAERAAIAHGMSGYTIYTGIEQKYVTKVREARRGLEDRYVWHTGTSLADSYATIRAGRAVHKRRPDAIGVYSRDAAGRLEFRHEKKYLP